MGHVDKWLDTEERNKENNFSKDNWSRTSIASIAFLFIYVCPWYISIPTVTWKY